MQTKTINLKPKEFDIMSSNNKENIGELFLIYVHNIGENSNDEYEYEFLFSTKPEVAIGIGWESKSYLFQETSDKKPMSKYIDKSFKLTTDIEFVGVQDIDDFRMLDSVYGVISLAWEQIDDYSLSETLPDELLTFKFGESKAEVDKKLYSRDLKLC